MKEVNNAMRAHSRGEAICQGSLEGFPEEVMSELRRFSLRDGHAEGPAQTKEIKMSKISVQKRAQQAIRSEIRPTSLDHKINMNYLHSSSYFTVFRKWWL
jgi:hypothetical protein